LSKGLIRAEDIHGTIGEVAAEAKGKGFRRERVRFLVIFIYHNSLIGLEFIKV